MKNVLLAKQQSVVNSANTFLAFKRLIGRQFKDKEVQEHKSHWLVGQWQTTMTHLVLSDFFPLFFYLVSYLVTQPCPVSTHDMDDTTAE
jgi:hypothetical protein